MFLLAALSLAHDRDEIANLVVANRLLARGHVRQLIDELAGELDRINVLIVIILVENVLISVAPTDDTDVVARSRSSQPQTCAAFDWPPRQSTCAQGTS